MKELKPCPFCGSQDIVEDSEYSTWAFRDYHFIQCSDCLSKTSQYVLREDAVKAWNRRAQ